MIADKFENIETYTGISKALAVGLNLLKEVDFTSVPDGKYFADSEGVLGSVVKKFIQGDSRLGASGNADRCHGGSGATWVVIRP